MYCQIDVDIKILKKCQYNSIVIFTDTLVLFAAINFYEILNEI